MPFSLWPPQCCNETIVRTVSVSSQIQVTIFTLKQITHPPEYVAAGNEHFQKLRERGHSFGDRDDFPEFFHGVMGVREIVLVRKVSKSG